MAAKLKPKTETRLITHRKVARMLGIDTETLREWADRGEFPEPHSVIVQTWFYRVETIAAFIETGKWPPGTKFKRGR